MLDFALAAGWGLALGGINHWILQRPLARLRAAQRDPAAAQVAARQIYGLFLVRMMVSLGGLAAAFLIWDASSQLGAVLGGLLVANGLSIWQNHRRASRFAAPAREGNDG